MIYRLIGGIVIGAILGGIIGYAGKCAGGACPLTCNPIGGLITGAVIGFLLVSSSLGSAGARADHTGGNTDNGMENMKVQNSSKDNVE